MILQAVETLPELGSSLGELKAMSCRPPWVSVTAGMQAIPSARLVTDKETQSTGIVTRDHFHRDLSTGLCRLPAAQLPRDRSKRQLSTADCSISAVPFQNLQVTPAEAASEVVVSQKVQLSSAESLSAGSEAFLRVSEQQSIQIGRCRIQGRTDTHQE